MTRKIVICRQCRTLLAQLQTQTKPSQDVLPEPGSFYIRPPVSDRHSEPIREDVNGWLVINSLDLHPSVSIAGDARLCVEGHLIGRLDDDLVHGQCVAVLDPRAVDVVATDAFFRTPPS